MTGEKTVFYLAVGVALFWYMTRDRDNDQPQADAAPKPKSVPSLDLATSSADLITFPEIDRSVDLTPLFCSPFDEYGGWGDDRKLAEATAIYIARWGFSPTPEFEMAVRERDPCVRRHVDLLVNAYPPFPGQTFTAGELLQKKDRQEDARKAQKAADDKAREDCQSVAVGASTVIVGGAAAVAGGLVGAAAGGVGAAPGAIAAGTAGAAAGGALGKWISGLWC